MSETQYTVVYVSDVANGAPWLDHEDRGMVPTVTAGGVVKDAYRGTVGQSHYLWVVKAGTPAHAHLCEHATGRISTFSSFPAKEWLSRVIANQERLSYPAEDFRPAVKGNGLGSTDNGKKIDASVIDGTTITTRTIDGVALQAGVNRAFENLNNTVKTMGLRASHEPTGPRTTLITQVDVNDVSPINDTLYNALVASGVEDLDGDQFPEDGNITIQWSKVHGRTNLRKFTITVDYKESK